MNLEKLAPWAVAVFIAITLLIATSESAMETCLKKHSEIVCNHILNR